MNSTRFVEALGQGALARVADLLVGDVERPDGDAVVPGHVECQRAPAASGLHHPSLRPQLQLPAHVLHLRALRVFEARAGRREVGAGVYHLAVEPQAVEVVSEIVVMVDVVPHRLPAVRPDHPAAHPLGPRPEATQRARQAGVVGLHSIEGREGSHEVAVHLETPGHVGLAKCQIRSTQQFEHSAAISDPDRRNGGRTGRWPALEVRAKLQHHRSGANFVSQPGQQPPVDEIRGGPGAWQDGPRSSDADEFHRGDPDASIGSGGPFCRSDPGMGTPLLPRTSRAAGAGGPQTSRFSRDDARARMRPPAGPTALDRLRRPASRPGIREGARSTGRR